MRRILIEHREVNLAYRGASSLLGLRHNRATGWTARCCVQKAMGTVQSSVGYGVKRPERDAHNNARVHS